jgi:hypothetical protein
VEEERMSKGEKQTMIDWSRSKLPQGFTALANVGKLEDTAEYLIISFSNDFPPMWSNWRSAGLIERTQFKIKADYIR